jgi:hypothetical protein
MPALQFVGVLGPNCLSRYRELNERLSGQECNEAGTDPQRPAAVEIRWGQLIDRPPESRLCLSLGGEFE